jgi:thymidylate synthase
MWRLYEAESGNQLWTMVMEAVRSKENSIVQNGRGGATNEILHAALTLKNPSDRWITVRQPAMNIAFLIAELVWILAGRGDAKFLTYFNNSLSKFAGTGAFLHGAYGERLRRHFGLDQLEHAYRALSSNPESRQVVLQIWDPKIDLPQHNGLPRDPDIPCNTQSILKVRNHRLEWLQIMRSNDIYLGLPHNLVQFTFLQEIIAGWLGLLPGHYHHVSDSLHLYERDANKVSVSPMENLLPNDVYLLPKLESELAVTRLAAAIDRITNENCGATEVARLPQAVVLPNAYRNMLCILCAEGLRRRQQAELGEQIMTTCTNPVFRKMWSSWLMRVISNTTQS